MINLDNGCKWSLFLGVNLYLLNNFLEAHHVQKQLEQEKIRAGSGEIEVPEEQSAIQTSCAAKFQGLYLSIQKSKWDDSKCFEKLKDNSTIRYGNATSRSDWKVPEFARKVRYLSWLLNKGLNLFIHFDLNFLGQFELIWVVNWDHKA